MRESMEKISHDLGFTVLELQKLFRKANALELILIEQALEKAVDLQKFIDRIKEGV